MWYGKEIRIEEGMSEAVEGGAAIAWRLLATLEGGSLLLATSALLAYTVRKKIAGPHRTGRHIRRVLVTNTTNLLGRELRKRLEDRGCEVDTINEDASRASDGAVSGADNGAVNGTKFDAIVIVGAEPKADGLDGMAVLVTEDVYDNLKLLESLSPRVRPGGSIAWACAGDAGVGAGAFSDAGAAFDTVLRASLQHIAKVQLVRYHQVILRSEFDKHKCVLDPKEQRRLLWLGENEVFKKMTPLPPCKFARSVGEAGGVAFERVVTPPDWVLDYWHPLEKAHFPEYFKRRECRKCEYIQNWHKGQMY